MRLRAAILGTGLLIMCLARVPARAQETQTDFLPEIDLHLKLNPNAQIFFQAKNDREGGDPRQGTLGPSFQFYRKPLWSLKRLFVFDLDSTKLAPWMLESGYRVITAPDTPVKNRLIEAMTFRFALLHQIGVGNRDRVDLDWQDRVFTWRFRNRLVVGRMFTIRSLHFAPYAAWEPFYLSQYGKFAATDIYAGVDVPVGKRVEFNGYYEHENNTGKSPNSQRNYVGLQLQLYFSLQDKPPAP